MPRTPRSPRTPRLPADGSPENDFPASDWAFFYRLQRLSSELGLLLGQVTALADEHTPDPEVPLDPDPLVDLARRFALQEITSHLLSARHALNGAEIGIIRARREIHPPRRPAPHDRRDVPAP